MQIKTLAEILAEHADTAQDSARSNNQHTQQFQQSNNSSSNNSNNNHHPRQHKRGLRGRGVSKHTDTVPPTVVPKESFEKRQIVQNPNADKANSSNSTITHKRLRKKSKRRQSFHPAAPYHPKTSTSVPIQSIDANHLKQLFIQTATSDCPDSEATATLDNLPAALKAYLKSPEQRQAEKEDIKANSRLRWLAFYYLSRREYSAEELRQKLIEKQQDPTKVDALLAEFAAKGYQSDYRTALMLIREGIRKGRGRLRIKQDFDKRKVDIPANIDELIDMAMEDNAAFSDIVANNTSTAGSEGVDWLRLAVEARVKKYGAAIPTEAKEKARQLRFLQYRGFKPDICFQAIKYNLENLNDRF